MEKNILKENKLRLILIIVMLVLFAATFNSTFRNGYRKVKLPDGSTYIGSFKNGLFHGQGKQIWNNGTIYAGEYKKGLPDGYGKMVSAAVTYKGNYKAGVPYGYGMATYSKGGIYGGMFKKGLFDGHGKETRPSGIIVHGEYKNGVLEGNATVTSAEGKILYEGRFEKGELQKPVARKTPNFIITSNCDTRYVDVIEKNVEAFYDELSSKVFHKKLKEPLRLFYMETRDDARAVIREEGYNKDFIQCVFYDLQDSMVVTYRTDEEGKSMRIGALFNMITRYFIYENFGDVPAWVNLGLSYFLGGASQIVNGKLDYGYPGPEADKAVQTGIENGQKADIRALISEPDDKFYYPADLWRGGLSRVLFYWIYDNGKLVEFLERCKKEGFGIEVIKKTLSMDENELNKKFLEFIKKNSYAAAIVWDAGDEEDKDTDKKIALLEKAMELAPEYGDARLELGRIYNDSNKSCKKTEDLLLPLISNKDSKHYLEAIFYLGLNEYRRKSYSKALRYFLEAWKCGEYDHVYCYLPAYWVANSYDALGVTDRAKEWYGIFLREDYEPSRKEHLLYVRFAKDYLSLHEEDD